MSRPQRTCWILFLMYSGNDRYSSSRMTSASISDDERDESVGGLDSDDDDDSDMMSDSASSRRRSGGGNLGSLSNAQFATAAEKRAHHNALERRRRDHIKDSFSSLRDAIPALQSEKASRATILKKASEYIMFMRRKNQSHQSDIDSLKEQNTALEQEIRSLERARASGNYAALVTQGKSQSRGLSNSNSGTSFGRRHGNSVGNSGHSSGGSDNTGSGDEDFDARELSSEGSPQPSNSLPVASRLSLGLLGWKLLSDFFFPTTSDLRSKFEIHHDGTYLHAEDGSVVNIDMALDKKAMKSSSMDIGVYYEALCPDTKRFFLRELQKSISNLPSEIISAIRLVPYGKATTRRSGSSYVFDCQHGEPECVGNRYHACVIEELKNDVKKQLEVTTCIFTYGMNAVEGAEKCCTQYELNFRDIQSCATGPKGFELLAKHGEDTHSLREEISFIPTVSFDHVNQMKQSFEALKDFRSTVCDYAKEYGITCSAT
ncbi:unnamed protein product [Cyprideis torosa]|uniref:Protein max n=1 Tax=Cyprideis torosa TaxID=163714 RepID=A0A7R8W4A9_9CRUS|nr:unnamed protein product [Cyprideis torosa]CAG0882932.1 unnamed protein product [Cyprideis torosa]